MADPLDKAAASALPTLGEGCLARFDPDAMSDEHGTEFVGAAELWRQLNPAVDGASAGVAVAPAGRQTPAPRPVGKSNK
ncbi:hypothetical protein [Pseudomonas plecoglossicida]|uniref:hypothetical protein n=1 Tax=Pseudomonas plecoglossicida TaxID=70775 RepID=UPI002159067B|nr:hypothetical protein [Pseudomonas plecoglossicida]